VKKGEATLLGLLHNKNRTKEQLFICSCGKKYWINNFEQQEIEFQCMACGSVFFMQLGKGRYNFVFKIK